MHSLLTFKGTDNRSLKTSFFMAQQKAHPRYGLYLQQLLEQVRGYFANRIFLSEERLKKKGRCAPSNVER